MAAEAAGSSAVAVARVVVVVVVLEVQAVTAGQLSPQVGLPERLVQLLPHRTMFMEELRVYLEVAQLPHLPRTTAGVVVAVEGRLLWLAAPQFTAAAAGVVARLEALLFLVGLAARVLLRRQGSAVPRLAEVAVEPEPAPLLALAHVVNYASGGSSNGTLCNHRRRARHQSCRS